MINANERTVLYVTLDSEGRSLRIMASGPVDGFYLTSLQKFVALMVLHHTTWSFREIVTAVKWEMQVSGLGDANYGR